MPELPIIFVDFVATDRGRIINVLKAFGLDCADSQAEQLRKHIGNLPQGDDELEAMLLEYVQVDWDKCPDKLEECLKKLDAEYRRATTDTHRQWIGKRMYHYTKGLKEHPSWWEQACGCDTCLSYS